MTKQLLKLRSSYFVCIIKNGGDYLLKELQKNVQLILKSTKKNLN